MVLFGVMLNCWRCICCIDCGEHYCDGINYIINYSIIIGNWHYVLYVLTNTHIVIDVCEIWLLW